MPRVEIICLANSSKMSGRCVAGLRTNREGWIRPVAGDTDHGQLYERHYGLGLDKEPETLDTIEIDLLRPAPIPGQPENWEIGASPWNLVRRQAGRESYHVLHAAVVSGPDLLGSIHASVRIAATAGLTSSLALVKPERVTFYVRLDQRRRLQPRAVSGLARQRYDLPITDPAWHTRIVRAISAEPASTGDGTDIGIPEASEILFTISLSEPFGGFCYKLVAGIIVLPGPP